MKISRIAFVLSCLCAAQILYADIEHESAEQKESALWNTIAATAYGDKLPEITSPGTWETTNLLDAEYDSKAFSHNGDLMIEGRAKLIHGFGTTAKVAFVPLADSPFTGLFNSGAPFGLMRVSLAIPPEGCPRKLVPGLALKFFVNGKPSLNLMAMPSLEGQTRPNIFENVYTTNVAKPAWSFKSWLLEERFSSALSYVGQSDGNPRSFSLKHFANMTSAGEEISVPKDPFALLLVPTKELRNLYSSESSEDFRVRLEEKCKGLELFEVFAQETVVSKPFAIGKIIAKSGFVASSFSDQHLFFKHPPVHTWSETESEDKPEL